jgi:hypothetical protein
VMRPASHIRAECDRVAEPTFQPVAPGSGMKTPVVKDQLPRRPVSSRVDLDRRGHAGQDTGRHQVSHRSDAHLYTRQGGTSFQLGTGFSSWRSELQPLTPCVVVGFKGERHKPSYRFVPPLDARRLPTCN